MKTENSVKYYLIIFYIVMISFPLISQAQVMPEYNTNSPVLLDVSKENTVQLEITPQQAIYQRMPTITAVYHGKEITTLHWQAHDGFGVKIAAGNMQLVSKSPQEIILPQGHGYYALTLQNGDREQHYSFGILPPILQKQQDIFGVWVQGMIEYPKLGVSWTRIPIHYEKWYNRKTNKKYKKHLHTILFKLKQEGISALFYPKLIPKSISISHNLIRDDRKSWGIFNQWLTEMVQEFDGEVAAWGLINEPFAYVLWKIPNKITMRYWQMMRTIIDKYSSNTPLIGPCLNVHKNAQLRQYYDLMKSGFGELVDGIELHTYMRNVSHNGVRFSHAMPEDIDWHTRMRKALLIAGSGKIKHALWITEMGMPAKYEEELQQASFVTRSALWIKYMQGNGIPIKMLNWHAFSYAQGGNDHARNYSLFRNINTRGKKSRYEKHSPQARPAAIAYGTSIRYLNGAKFVRQWSNLPAHTYAFEFINKGKHIVALWTTKGKENIHIPKRIRQATLSNMFGKKLRVPQKKTLKLSHEPIWIEYK
ncbi:MAG: hypothetical protein Q9M28_04255 [Mariprofundaceae bacterium]|nr:hypothetical protein [Mariprofundaceae bacterium]